MDFSDGSTVGMIGFALMLVGFLAILVIGIWASIAVLEAVSPLLASANGTITANALNSTGVTQLAQNVSVGLANELIIPSIIAIAIIVIGLVLAGIALVSYGKKYGNNSIRSWGAYGTVVSAVGFALMLSFSFSSLIILVGAIIYAYVFKKLSEEAEYKNISYYGYGLVACALFLLLYFPFGVIAFIVVDALLVMAFRNLGKAKVDENPFDTNPSSVVKKPARHGKKGNR